jgi:hypothetical protein
MEQFNLKAARDAWRADRGWELEHLPCLSAGFLVKHGFSRHKHSGPAFESNFLKILPIKCGSELAIFIELHRDIACQVVRFDVGIVNNGLRFYFTCPVTERKCSKIFFHNGRWASRDGHKLRSQGDARVRRKRRLHLERIAGLTTKPLHDRALKIRREGDYDALRSEILELGFLPEGSEALLDIFDAEARAVEKRRRRNVRAQARHETSLQFALDQGEELSADCLRRLISAWHSGPFISTIERSSRRGRLEQYPCLDLNTLRRTEFFSEVQSCGWRLGWPPHVSGHESVTLLSYDEPTGLGLMVEFRELDGGLHYQKIRFGSRPEMGRRLFLECPVRGTLHDKLYLRHGYFAGSTAQHLQPLSQ